LTLMSRTLFLCGAGNSEGVRLALRVNQARPRWDRICLLDDDPRLHGERRLDVPVVGGFDRLLDADAGVSEVVNLVARTTHGRRVAAGKIEAAGIPWTRLVSPDVDLLGTEVAGDLVAYQNATIGPEARIGPGTVVFMGAAVGHECRVGSGCVIAANSVLNARVRLGDGVYVGTNATVLPEVEVGPGATIGAGATVLDDVPAGATVIGPRSELMGDLMQPGPSAGRPTPQPTVPAPEVERRLAEVWREILGVERIDPNQNFFDLGGTSLLALRMVTRVETVFGVRISPVEVFRCSTVRSLAGRLGAGPEAHGEVDQARLRAKMRREALASR
jgi:sugar O-acyltransferase (sialic acid O-acetyltransferase NeuD family)